MKKLLAALFAAVLFCGAFVSAQDTPSSGSSYTPKFKGDPAKSDAEAAALGYMRVVVNAQKNYKKKHGDYATSLQALVGQGSFTKRMLATTRGDYTVKFKGEKTGYSLWMTPGSVSPTQRAFFVDESGKIKAEEDKQASVSSPSVSGK